MTRFAHSANPADADAAVDAARRAAVPDGHPLRANQLDKLGDALRHRGRHRHNLADLTEAVRVHEQAVSVAPHGSTTHASCLASLCRSRVDLFEHTGQLAVLDAAVDAGWQALRDGADVPERSDLMIPSVRHCVREPHALGPQMTSTRPSRSSRRQASPFPTCIR
ncbi:hypothetical protein ACFQZ4_37870 [Catellatospora coxensis]